MGRTKSKKSNRLINMSSVKFSRRNYRTYERKSTKGISSNYTRNEKNSPVCHFRQVNLSIISLKAPSKNGG